MKYRIIILIIVCAVALAIPLLITACGGGGGSSSTSTTVSKYQATASAGDFSQVSLDNSTSSDQYSNFTTVTAEGGAPENGLPTVSVEDYFYGAALKVQ